VVRLCRFLDQLRDVRVRFAATFSIRKDFTTTMSTVSIRARRARRMCSGFPRIARMPRCILGCMF